MASAGSEGKEVCFKIAGKGCVGSSGQPTLTNELDRSIAGSSINLTESLEVKDNTERGGYISDDQVQSDSVDKITEQIPIEGETRMREAVRIQKRRSLNEIIQEILPRQPSQRALRQKALGRYEELMHSCAIEGSDMTEHNFDTQTENDVEKQCDVETIIEVKKPCEAKIGIKPEKSCEAETKEHVVIKKSIDGNDCATATHTEQPGARNHENKYHDQVFPAKTVALEKDMETLKAVFLADNKNNAKRGKGTRPGYVPSTSKHNSVCNTSIKEDKDSNNKAESKPTQNHAGKEQCKDARHISGVQQKYLEVVGEIIDGNFENIGIWQKDVAGRMQKMEAFQMKIETMLMDKEMLMLRDINNPVVESPTEKNNTYDKFQSNQTHCCVELLNDNIKKAAKINELEMEQKLLEGNVVDLLKLNDNKMQALAQENLRLKEDREYETQQRDRVLSLVEISSRLLEQDCDCRMKRVKKSYEVLRSCLQLDSGGREEMDIHSPLGTCHDTIEDSNNIVPGTYENTAIDSDSIVHGTCNNTAKVRDNIAPGASDSGFIDNSEHGTYNNNAKNRDCIVAGNCSDTANDNKNILPGKGEMGTMIKPVIERIETSFHVDFKEASSDEFNSLQMKKYILALVGIRHPMAEKIICYLTGLENQIKEYRSGFHVAQKTSTSIIEHVIDDDEEPKTLFPRKVQQSHGMLEEFDDFTQTENAFAETFSDENDLSCKINREADKQLKEDEIKLASYLSEIKQIEQEGNLFREEFEKNESQTSVYKDQLDDDEDKIALILEELEKTKENLQNATKEKEEIEFAKYYDLKALQLKIDILEEDKSLLQASYENSTEELKEKRIALVNAQDKVRAFEEFTGDKLPEFEDGIQLKKAVKELKLELGKAQIEIKECYRKIEQDRVKFESLTNELRETAKSKDRLKQSRRNDRMKMRRMTTSMEAMSLQIESIKNEAEESKHGKEQVDFANEQLMIVNEQMLKKIKSKDEDLHKKCNSLQNALNKVEKLENDIIENKENLNRITNIASFHISREIIENSMKAVGDDEIDDTDDFEEELQITRNSTADIFEENKIYEEKVSKLEGELNEAKRERDAVFLWLEDQGHLDEIVDNEEALQTIDLAFSEEIKSCDTAAAVPQKHIDSSIKTYDLNTICVSHCAISEAIECSSESEKEVQGVATNVKYPTKTLDLTKTCLEASNAKLNSDSIKKDEFITKAEKMSKKISMHVADPNIHQVIMEMDQDDAVNALENENLTLKGVLFVKDQEIRKLTNEMTEKKHELANVIHKSDEMVQERSKKIDELAFDLVKQREENERINVLKENLIKMSANFVVESSIINGVQQFEKERKNVDSSTQVEMEYLFGAPNRYPQIKMVDIATSICESVVSEKETSELPLGNDATAEKQRIKENIVEDECKVHLSKEALTSNSARLISKDSMNCATKKLESDESLQREIAMEDKSTQVGYDLLGARPRNTRESMEQRQKSKKGKNTKSQASKFGSNEVNTMDGYAYSNDDSFVDEELREMIAKYVCDASVARALVSLGVDNDDLIKHHLNEFASGGSNESSSGNYSIAFANNTHSSNSSFSEETNQNGEPLLVVTNKEKTKHKSVIECDPLLMNELESLNDVFVKRESAKLSKRHSQNGCLEAKYLVETSPPASLCEVSDDNESTSTASAFEFGVCEIKSSLQHLSSFGHATVIEEEESISSSDSSSQFSTASSSRDGFIQSSPAVSDESIFIMNPNTVHGTTMHN